MFGTTDIVVVAVVPFLAAVLISAIARWTGMRGDHAVPLAIGLGFLSGAVAMAARDRVPLHTQELSAMAAWGRAANDALRELFQPREALGWLVLFSLVAMAAAVAEWSLSRWRLLVWAALFIALLVRMLWGSVYFVSEWTLVGSVWRVLAIAAAMLAILVGAFPDRLVEKIQPPAYVATIVACTILAGGVAIVLLLTGSKTYGEAAGTFCAALLGTLATGVNTAEASDRRAAGGLMTLIFGGLLVLGCCFAETNVWQAIGLAAAGGLALLVISRMAASRRSRWITVGVMSLVVLAVCLQAGFQFRADVRAEPNPYNDFSS